MYICHHLTDFTCLHNNINKKHIRNINNQLDPCHYSISKPGPELASCEPGFHEFHICNSEKRVYDKHLQRRSVSGLWELTCFAIHPVDYYGLKYPNKSITKI